MTAGPPGQLLRTGDGEEALLLPDAALIRSRGALPLRSRVPEAHHGRPAFAGTAVAIGDAVYEVVSHAGGDGSGVVYTLRAWPHGEIARHRVTWDGAFVQSVQAEREAARFRERVQPYRFLLYPLVGALPAPEQERACERLGLYSVTATLVSGLVESVLVAGALLALLRASETGAAILLLGALPGLVLFVLPGLGRAFGAVFLRETAGSAPVALALEALEALGRPRRRPPGLAPLTRAAFWERLAEPDVVERRGEGSLVHRGALPHLSWDDGRRLLAGHDWWSVEPLTPERQDDRLVYPYVLTLLGDPPPAGEPRAEEPGGLAYADEVLGEVRCDWDALNEGFAWLTSMLSEPVQARAFAHRGGSLAARRPALWTALATGAVGVYVLQFLPGPPGDPFAPLAGALSVAAIADTALRLWRLRKGRYAPSLFRFALPSDWLRPERRPYLEHRAAERLALDLLRRSS